MISLNVVLPLMLMMGVGVLVRKSGLADEALLRRIDAVSFRVFVPSLQFYSICAADFEQAFDPGLIGYAVVCVLVVCALSLTVMPRLEKARKKIAVLIQLTIRTNFIIMGMAVMRPLYGDYGGAVVSMLGSVMVPLTNAMSVVILEYYQAERVNVKGLVVSVLRNPLVIASAAGIGLKLLHLELPEVLFGTVGTMAGATTPLCLLTLGGTLTARGLVENRRQILIGNVAKMVIIPVVFLTLSVLLGFRKESLGALMVMFAAPTAVSSFSMAQQLGADGRLAGQLVATTTAMSVLTLFICTFLFLQLGFL